MVFTQTSNYKQLKNVSAFERQRLFNAMANNSFKQICKNLETEEVETDEYLKYKSEAVLQ